MTMSEITAQQGPFLDANLHVEDTGGSGRPVVLIHGWPLTGESWSAQVDALQAAGYRVITYDRRGFGRSDKPVMGYTYEALADDLAALLETLDLRDATLVGFSMGGGEVANYCARYGVDRLRSVVFASSVTPYLLTTRKNPSGPLGKRRAAAMAAALTKNRTAFFERFVTDFFTADGQVTVGEDQRRAALQMCEQSGTVAALACLSAFSHTDFSFELSKVEVPALVIHGDADAIVPIEGSGERTHAALGDSRLHVIAGGPHGVPMSHADEFTAALLDFLGQEFATAQATAGVTAHR
jgi:non-heme chloroperoxidase